jgi:putative peptidoglycan lipid II flippase
MAHMTTAAGPADAGGRARRGGHAAVVAAGIFLSRIAGLVRQGTLAHFLGTSGAMTAYTAAMRIPNFLQNLLGEGVLSASMIPVYANLLAKGDTRAAGRVAGTIVSLLALVTAALVVAGVLLAPVLVTLLAPGLDGDTRMLTVRLVRILFPGIGLLVLSAWCLAVLNSHRSFFIPYVAPVLWNFAIVGAVLLFAGGGDVEAVAEVAAWGVVLGGALQLGVQVPFVLRRAVPMQYGFATTLAPVQQVFRNFGPVVFGRGVVQVSAFVDEILASYLTKVAIGAIGYAYTIYLLPFSLFGMAVSAAELPAMSSVVGSDDEIARRLRERLHRGLRQIAFWVVPSVVAFFAIGDDLVAALYQRGAFTDQSTLYVWTILMGYSVGLLAGTWSRLYSSALYALNDTRTPLRFAIVRVAVAGVSGWLLAFPLRPRLVSFVTQGLGLPLPDLTGSDVDEVDATVALGAVGLACASGFASWIEFGLLRRALSRRVGRIPADRRFHVTLWGAALGAALAGWIVSAAGATLHPIPRAVAGAGTFGAVYLALTAALQVPEVAALTRRLRR